MNIVKTLSSLSTSGKGRPVSDSEILKWANTTVQKGKAGARTIRSFKDPYITTGVFFLDLLEALRPGIVDPSMIVNVSENGDYEDRRQNGMLFIILGNVQTVC
jgi:plastin-1